MPDPTPADIPRREAIRRITTLMGGALSAPTLAGLLAGCEAPAPGIDYALRTLTPEQHRLLDALVEILIPTTDTPGASAARVPDYIDMMLTDFFGPERRTEFVAGLARVDDLSRSLTGSDLLAAAPADRPLVVEALDAEAFPEAYGEAPADPASEGTPFMRTLKELTVSGYYTSEIGATVELHQAPYTEYRGDVPLDEVGRTWA